jgi:hypothetical protein
MSAKIGEYSEGHLLNVAKDLVDKKTTGSVLLDTHAEGRIPKFQLEGMNPRQNALLLPHAVRIHLVLICLFFF